MRIKYRLGKYVKDFFLCGDFIAVNIAYLLIAFFFHLGTPYLSKWTWLILNVAIVPAVYFFPVSYNLRFIYIDKILINAIKSSVSIICIFISLLYLLDVYEIELLHGVSLLVLMFFSLSAVRICMHLILKRIRQKGFNFRRAIIIGGGRTAELLAKETDMSRGFGIRFFGFFDNNPHKLYNLPPGKRGLLSDVEEFVRENNIDTIYYTLDAEDYDKIYPVMQLSTELGIEFIYVPKLNKLLLGQFQPSHVGQLPSMEYTFSPLSKMKNRFVKRVADLLVSVPFLIVSPLIFIPIAIGIKITSPGPIFFRQKRTGIYGREFVCYKFRTMRVNTDADKVQATENDPRKTKFGDFLRRSSLDELPQFFNVFLGNMSVVGPRPHMVMHTEEYMRLIDKYMVRHAIKPGITGWAQVNGYRGGTKHLWQMEKRVEYDVWYIRNWNIFLDIKIIIMTIFNSIHGEKNAY